MPEPTVEEPKFVMNADAEMPPVVAAGDLALDFDLPASGGRRVTLAGLLGRPFVLYFYPKADTSGCTREACDFQEALGPLGASGLAVVGVSRDPVRALDAFAAKFGLEFPLAADIDGSVVAAYGSWVEKSMYGRRYMGIERSTFLVAADGRIVRAWRKVKVPGHAAEVLKAAAAL
jgi:peroxiredoxin Q/BCP